MIIDSKYIDSVNPANNKFGKFSPRMYKFLLKYKNKDIKAYQKSDEDGVLIGYADLDGWDVTSLFNICRSYGKLDRLVFLDKTMYKLTEIPHWFDDYQKIGRCIYTPHDWTWIANGDNRFGYSNLGHIRTCNWCGEVAHRKVCKEVETNWREIWD